MDNCRLDTLPVELVHHLLNYFSAHEIFYTFSNVSSYIDAVLVAYSYYRMNCKSITKSNFDLVCQCIEPTKVIALTLSNDEDTPGLVELFLSRFQITQFTRLQSLRLIDVGADHWECIVGKLIELKNLRSFLYFSPDRTNSWISNISEKDLVYLDTRLFDHYAPVLSQLNRLRLWHDDFFKSVQFPNLHHLVIERSSVSVIQHIFAVAPQLKSLDTSFTHNASRTELIFPSSQLNRLILRIRGEILKKVYIIIMLEFLGSYISMNNIERMMSNWPCLRHLQLVANCNKDVIDGHRWQTRAKYLITFKFIFDLSAELEPQDLDSFRTSFWLEEKRWFVAYSNTNLYSVPYINETYADVNFQLPLYSTVPDKKIFYESIGKLNISERHSDANHYFTHVQTLVIRRHIDQSSIEKIVNLSRIQHLILHVFRKDFPILNLIDQLPILHRISIESNVKKFLTQVPCEIIEKIKTLDISDSLMPACDYDVKKLSNIFPNIQHLHVFDKCSVTRICEFLHQFKHLSTASFHYTTLSASEEDSQQCFLDTLSEFARMQFCKQFNLTYRFNSLSVYIWISK
jgi:hypothetical protein